MGESALERRDRGERNSSSSPEDAAHEDQGSGPAGPPGWETVRKAWADAVRKGHGKPWGLATPPDKLPDRLEEHGWFEKFLAALDRLPSCRYFRDPVTLPQLVAPGFVDKVLGGQFDNPREPRGGRGPVDDRPDPHATWSDEDRKRFEATKRAMAAKLREGAA